VSHPVDLSTIYWPAQSPKNFESTTFEPGVVHRKDEEVKAASVHPLKWSDTWRLLDEAAWVRPSLPICNAQLTSGAPVYPR